MPTVAEVLKRIERIKKDLEYVKSFEEKWRDQRDRFPKIYEGILEQQRTFQKKVDELRNLGVNVDESVMLSPLPADETGDELRLSLPAPEIEGRNQGTRKRRDSDDKRAAADSIGEKLRSRKGSGVRVADAAAK